MPIVYVTLPIGILSALPKPEYATVCQPRRIPELVREGEEVTRDRWGAWVRDAVVSPRDLASAWVPSEWLDDSSEGVVPVWLEDSELAAVRMEAILCGARLEEYMRLCCVARLLSEVAHQPNEAGL